MFSNTRKYQQPHTLTRTHTHTNTHTYSCDRELLPWPLFPSPFWKGCFFISLPGEAVWPWEWDHTLYLLFTSLSCTCILFTHTHTHTYTHIVTVGPDFLDKGPVWQTRSLCENMVRCQRRCRWGHRLNLVWVRTQSYTSIHCTDLTSRGALVFLLWLLKSLLYVSVQLDKYTLLISQNPLLLNE